jgi:hypothetical protein
MSGVKQLSVRQGCYLAGVFDCMGELHFDRITAFGNLYTFYSPVVAVRSPDKPLIARLHSDFGGLFRGSKTISVIYWRKRERAAVLRAMIPHLLLKREQAELLLEFIEHLTIDGRDHMPEERARRAEIIEEVDRLNASTKAHQESEQRQEEETVAARS